MTKRQNVPADKEQKEMSREFSFFPQGFINKEGKAVMNCVPQGTMDIMAAYRYITDPTKAKRATETLRTISDHNENSRYKLQNFATVTFSCQCTYRNAKNVTMLTPYLVLDYDEEDIRLAYPDGDITEIIAHLKREMLSDRNLSTCLFCTSPNGNGMKQVIYVGDKQGLSHKECFTAISRYMENRYGIRPDASGSDVTRPCYMPYDPECYVCNDVSALTPPKVNLRMWLPVKKKFDVISVNPPYGEDDVFALVEKWVSRHTQYAETTYNRYVCQCGYLLCEFGVSHAEAEQWAVGRFNDYNSSDVRSIIASCYRNGSFGKRQFVGKS